MEALNGRRNINDYEVVSSTSLRPRLQWIRSEGKWRSPIHFEDKTATPLRIRTD
jgi:hypothetical protein